MNKCTFTLNNGYEIPKFGFGTYLAEDKTLIESVKIAINSGYRLIDTAAFYNNESALGFAIKDSEINRNELFITSKVWNTDRGYKQTKLAFEKSLNNLKLDYLDLYLIHWPANKKQFSNAKEINAQTWKAMEELYLEGKINGIIEIKEMGGFKLMLFNNYIPIVTHPDIEDDVIYFIDSGDFEFHQLCDWQWLDCDGKVLKQNPTKPVYEATLVKYGNIICENPYKQIKIKIKE